MNRRERRATTRKSQTSHNGHGASTPGALYETGLGHMLAGRHLDAQICCQQALAADSDHADALHLMGLLSFQAKQYDHAVQWLARAIRQSPKPEYLSNLGSALRHQGQNEEALKVFDKAAQLKPEDAEIWTNLGKTLVDLKRPADALLSFQHAVKLAPGHRDAAFASGAILLDLQRFDEALGYLDLCNELTPDHALTLRKRAHCLYGLKKFEKVLADCKRADALDPGDAETHNSIAVSLHLLHRDEEALLWYDRALEIRPNFTLAWVNKAVSLQQLHRLEEAVAACQRAKAIDPDHAEANVALGCLHLLMGNFEAGWPGYEARLRLPSAVTLKFPQPPWLGEESIEGKTILIHVDEGLGDILQFARYVPMVAARGARVILVVVNSLRSLLSGLNGVSECRTKSDGPLPAFDLHCPISSLPLAFGTRLDTVPSTTPYLPAPAQTRVQAWENRLGPHTRLRVGLVWSGNPIHKNDHNRSIPLRAMARILDIDATFVSLQVGPRAADHETLRERPDIIDMTAALTDFSETAALVSCLDLVITVDTSVAHLAGALGCPTWVLLPYTPDWRWLLDRDDNPWYPTMRLFRQSQSRDYGEVLDRVRNELLTLISTR